MESDISQRVVITSFSTELKAFGCDFNIPELYVLREEDGGFQLEWILKDLRIGLTIGPKEHGWYVVSEAITASGPLTLSDFGH